MKEKRGLIDSQAYYQFGEIEFWEFLGLIFHMDSSLLSLLPGGPAPGLHISICIELSSFYELQN